jgi:hypothetical protein
MKGQSLSRLMLLAVLAVATSAGWSWAAEKFPTGTYVSGDFSVTFQAAGEVIVAQNGETVVEGTYKVIGHKIEFTDLKGRYACTESVPGKYNWKKDGQALSFEKVEDDCQGRLQVLTGQPLKRKAE